MTDTKHLWQRGHQWYLKLPIPRPLQKHFLTSAGKPKSHIVESLDDSLSQARLKRNRLVTAYEEIFARLRNGEVITPEQINLAIVAATQHPLLQIAKWTTGEGPINISVDGDTAHVGDNVYTRIGDRWVSRHLIELVEKLGIGQQPNMTGETISQAAEAWYQHLQSDPDSPRRQSTLDEHRQRVQSFIDHVGRDIALANVTRAMAFDFLSKTAIARKLSNRTYRKYYQTLFGIFNLARLRGRFTGENPFAELNRKAKDVSYEPFTIPELQKLFDSFQFETKPNKHSPATALPWVSLIALFTGMRQEEICQLKASDIHDEPVNGGTLTVIDIHNGGGNHLKNESSVRLVPVHSQLVRAGLLQYRDALPESSLLFPGLTRRESKGDKIGGRISELFRKQLVRLGIKRDLLCFHSLRHNVTGTLDAAELRQTDVARVLGHKIEEETFRTYSKGGPGLKTLAAVVEKIEYPGLVILPAKDC
jgi:integrase